MKDLIIGTDPEFMLKDGTTGEFVSALGLVGGTKECPSMTPYGGVQEDNITAEISPKPAASEDEFVKNITDLRGYLDTLILKPLGLKSVCVPHVVATDEMLLNPAAYVAGCDPDFDAWSGRENDPPDYMNEDDRYAGGHVHISHPIFKDNPIAQHNCVKFCDLLLGVPSVQLDTCDNRRGAYGTAGRFRPTKYPDGSEGIEYRTLSNFWLESEELIRWVYNQAKRAVEMTIEHGDEDALTHMYGDIVSTINTSSRPNSEYLVLTQSIQMPPLELKSTPKKKATKKKKKGKGIPLPEPVFKINTLDFETTTTVDQFLAAIGDSDGVDHT